MLNQQARGEVIPPNRNQSPAVVRGFSQMFGVHPAIGAMTIAVDIMVNAGRIATLETGLIPLSIGAGVLMAVMTFIAQRKWYDDDNESALVKALMIGTLTAIPTSLPNALLLRRPPSASFAGRVKPWRSAASVKS